MVPVAAHIRKLRVVGRSRRNAGFGRWKTPVSLILHRGCNRDSYDSALGRSNHLYSVAAVTSSTGAVVERWSYNAYGVPTIKNSANATIAKSAVGNDRGFTGYKLDSETGLYAARARMYSAKLGRFISRDPWMKNSIRILKAMLTEPRAFAGMGYPNGFNSYFAYMIPNKLDPSGLAECCLKVQRAWAVAGYSSLTECVNALWEESDPNHVPGGGEWYDDVVIMNPKKIRDYLLQAAVGTLIRSTACNMELCVEMGKEVPCEKESIGFLGYCKLRWTGTCCVPK